MVGSMVTRVPVRNASLRRTCVINAQDVEIVSGNLAGETFPMPDDLQLGDMIRARHPQPLWVVTERHGTQRRVSGDSPMGREGDVLATIATVTMMAPGNRKASFQMLQMASSNQILLAPDAGFETGVDYTLVALDQTDAPLPDATARHTAFGRGTGITLADGTTCRAEDLCPGDRVRTVDGGEATLMWAGCQQVRTDRDDAPVIIGAGVLGNKTDLMLAPHTRIMLDNWRAEVMCGSREVLLEARDLIGCDNVWAREAGAASYVSLVFDRHEVICADGAWVESLQITPATFAALPAHQKTEILGVFPDIIEQSQSAALGGRMALETGQAEALLRQIGIQ